MALIRDVAIVEAHTLTGPAKNVIRFCRRASAGSEGFPAVKASIAAFYRQVGAKNDAKPSNQFIEMAREAGIEVDVVAERFRFDPGVIGQLTEIVRRRAPDIIETHSVKSHFVVRLCGLRRWCRWVAFHHGYTAEDLKMRLYNRLDRWSLPAADRVVTDCRPFADALVRAGVNRSRIHVLPSSVEGMPPVRAADIAALRERLGIASGERIILGVGRLSREKAQFDLIRATGRLTRLRPDLRFRLVLVGAGPERQRLEETVGEEGLASRVVFTGHQPDVRPYYALAHMFVLPSHSEGSPNVLLEAMMAGVPVVATAVGGVPDTIEHEKTGLLVRAGDIDALAAAMARLMTDADLATRLPAGAKSTAADRFSPEAYRRSLVGIYSRLGRGEVRFRRAS